MKKIRLLSAFLTVVMVIGMLNVLPVVAANTSNELVPGYDVEEGETTIDYITQIDRKSVV